MAQCFVWIFLIKIFVLEFDVFNADEINSEALSPPLPNSVTLIPIDTSTLQLRWSQPTNSNETLTGFNITWDENGTSVDNSTTTFSITKLRTPGKRYTANISATYADGGISELVSVSNNTYPKPAENITVLVRLTDRIDFQWMNDGESDKCFVWVTDLANAIVSCFDTNKTAIVSNLTTAGKEYNINIRIQSGQLNSMASMITERTSPAIPSSLYCSSTMNASLSVAVVQPSGSFELDGYNISIKSKIPSFSYSDNWAVNASTAGPNITVIKTGLTAGVTYWIAVRTRIRDLVSNNQITFECTTDLNAPVNVHITNSSETAVEIAWNVPTGNLDGFNASCVGQNNAKDSLSVLRLRPGPGYTVTTTCTSLTAGALYAVTVSTILNQTLLTPMKSADPVWIATAPLSPKNVTAYPNDSNSIQMELLYGYDVSESQCTNYEILYSNKAEVIACDVTSVKLCNLQADSLYNISTYSLSNYSYLNRVASMLNKSRNPVQTLAWTLAPPVTNITGNETLPRSLEVAIGNQSLNKNVWQYVINVTNSTHLVQRVNITCTDVTKMILSSVNCQWTPPLLILDRNATCNAGLVYNVTELRPYTNYTVSVQAVNPGGCSQPESIALRTNESTPLCLNIANTSVTTKNMIDVTWFVAQEPNGVITGYQLTYSYDEGRDLNVTTTEVVETNETFITLEGLDAYVNYTIKVAAVNRVGVGTYEGCAQSTVTVQTAIGSPYQPELTVTPQSPRSALINWTLSVDRRTAPETYYNLTITDVLDPLQIFSRHIIGFDNRSVVVDDLDEYWNYSVSIVAYTIDEDDEELETNGSETVSFRTLESTPGRVASFSVTSLSTEQKCNASKVTWTAPDQRDLNGIITQYIIRWQQVSGGDNGSRKEPANRRETIIEVKPDNRRYSFMIRAETNAGEGTSMSFNLQSTGSCFPTPVQNVSRIFMKAGNGEEASTTKSFPVLFDQDFFVNNDNGEVKQSGLFIREVSDGENVTEKAEMGNQSLYTRSLTWSEAIRKDRIPEYRATLETWLSGASSSSSRKKRSSTMKYIIGQNDSCSTDHNITCNGPLPSNRAYRVRAIVCTEKGCYKTEYAMYIYRTRAQESMAWIAAVVIPVIAVIVVALIVGYFCLIRRNQNPCNKKDDKNPDLPLVRSDEGRRQFRITSKPIRLDNFKEIISSMHYDSDLLFSDEYKEIQESSLKYPWTEAEREMNKAKNRFINILAFDKTRVILEQTQTGSGYINANYVLSGSNLAEYIAAQGPLPTTIDDFWLMIWQEKSTVVVMLTNLRENGRVKCEQYWPQSTNEAEQFGSVSVTMTDEQDFASYVFRRFTVKVKSESLQVSQFHFVAWPDFGVPAQPQTLIDFVKVVRKCIGQRIEPPTIVHCSAGVGRTGTFIALDRLLRQVQGSTTSIDVFGTILQLREFRCQMVQTETQYIFIHDCMSLEIERIRSAELRFLGSYNSAYDRSSEPFYVNLSQINQASISTFGEIL